MKFFVTFRLFFIVPYILSMAYQQFICMTCHQPIIDPTVDIVEYICGHLEHVDCYYELHHHNLKCLICHMISSIVYFY